MSNHPDGALVRVDTTTPLRVDLTSASITLSGSPPSALFYGATWSASGVVKATSGTIWSIYAASQVNQDLWLLVWNLNAVPVAGTKSEDFIQIPRRNNGSAGIWIPRTCPNGIVWAASADPENLVVPVANPLLVRARYT